MTSTPTIPPLTGTTTVDAPVEQVFRTFTDGFGSWWPAQYHIGQADMATGVLEPREGGRWYEQGTDGSECDWGRVLAWEPPPPAGRDLADQRPLAVRPRPRTRQRDRGPLQRRRLRPDHRQPRTPTPGAAGRRPGPPRRDHRRRRLVQPPGAARQGRHQPDLTQPRPPQTRAIRQPLAGLHAPASDSIALTAPQPPASGVDQARVAA
jgi:hypothetical protein